jgi:PKHD-type hydroxylase
MAFAYYKYDNVISSDMIKDILSNRENWGSASVGDPNFGISTKKELRKTDIIWLDDQKYFDMFWDLGQDANLNGGWNLQLSCMESFQLGRYKDGGFYGWHVDGDMMTAYDLPQNSFMDKNTRKLSMVCWLNDDFDGGEFEFHPAYNIPPLKPTKGTVLFFPSSYVHRVVPVTQGERYSLVSWFLGKPIV